MSASTFSPSIARAGDRLWHAVAPVRRGIEREALALGRAWRSVVIVVRPLARLMLERIRPYVSVISSAGWAVMALALCALLFGTTLLWLEFTYVALTLIGALLVAVVFTVGRSTYEVTIELQPSRVVVGGRAMGRMLVVNNGLKPLLPSGMEFPVGDGLAEFSIPSLKPNAEHDEIFAIPTHRRAVVVAGPVLSVRGDQLGLLRRTVRWTDPHDLFVHPVTTQLTPSAAGLVRDLEGQITKKITNNDIAFHALRPYVPGDDRRYVHWRTSARTGQLMVRQFEETRRSQLTVIYSEYEAYYASDEEFELAVSVATSIGTQVIRDGTQISVVTETQHLRTHSPIALLDDSCRLGPIPKRHPDARSFARAVTRRLPAPSVLMVVAGSGMSIADYRSMSSLFPIDTKMLAFRVEEGAHPTLRPIAGMQVATIGALGDLPLIMRRASS